MAHYLTTESHRPTIETDVAAAVTSNRRIPMEMATRRDRDQTPKFSTVEADPAMGGPRPLPAPIDQNMGMVVTARSSLPQTRGQIFI